MDVECIGERIEHFEIGQLPGVSERRLEGTRAALPVEERAGLLDGRCDREDDVGGVGHIGASQLEAHHEARGVNGCAGRSRIGQVVGVDTGHHECTQRATRRGVENAVSVATRLGRNRGRPMQPDLTARVDVG